MLFNLFPKSYQITRSYITTLGMSLREALLILRWSESLRDVYHAHLPRLAIYESSDENYKLAGFGLWSDAEFAIGIIIGCFPVMPPFVQHFGPNISEALSFRSKSTSSTSHDPRDRSKTFKSAAAGKSKTPFAKYRVGSGICESYNDAYAQHHDEYYTLDELETSRAQTETTSPPSQAPGMVAATRRDDSEYGHQGFQVVGGTEQQSTWAEATGLDNSHRTRGSYRGFEQVRGSEVYDSTQCSTHCNDIPINAVKQCPQPHHPSQPLHKPHPRPRAMATSPPLARFQHRDGTIRRISEQHTHAR